MDTIYWLIIALSLAQLTAIIELYRGTLKKKFGNKLNLILLIFIIAIFFVNAIILIKNQEHDKYSEYSGQISGELKNKNIKYPVLKLGGANFQYAGPSGEPLFIIGKDPLKVWIENGQLKLSTIIRDSSGKIIAKIEANEWQVNPNPNLILDRNFDENAVEVIDAKGDVILQAYIDGEAVQFAGIFYRDDGSKVALGPEEGGGVIEIRPPNEKLTISFEPLFKYPSSLHLGERKK